MAGHGSGIDRVVIVATRPAAVARLLAAFAAAGITVDVWSPFGSRLGYSRHVRHVTVLPDDARVRVAQLAQLARSLTDRDLVVLGCDEDLREVVDAAPEAPELLRLLPVRGEHRAAVGSKIGTAELLRAADVDTPRSAVARDREALGAAIAEVGPRAMVKADRSGGGLGTREVSSPGDADRAVGDGPWLVEELVDGLPVSIDLVVVGARVAVAPYSLMGSTHGGPFGISVTRAYRTLDDDRLAADLDGLAGHLGGTWLANASAIRRPDGSHAVFELDLRPNVWHAYAPQLGHPLVPALRALHAGHPVPPWPRTMPPTRVVNVMRSVQATLRGEPRHLRELLPLRDSLRWAHRGDARLSYREARDVAREVVARQRRRLG